jgi:type IV secretory pathway VirB3-like protein
MCIYITIINITLFIFVIVIILHDMGRMTDSDFPVVNKYLLLHNTETISTTLLKFWDTNQYNP